MNIKKISIFILVSVLALLGIGYVEVLIKFSSTIKEVNQYRQLSKGWAGLGLNKEYLKKYKVYRSYGRDRIIFDAPHVLTIYGMIDADKQDEVISKVQHSLDKVDSLPILVEFYEKEVWNKHGLNGRIRGKEILIRDKFIEELKMSGYTVTVHVEHMQDTGLLDPGHAFITLTKPDGSSITRGYYPSNGAPIDKPAPASAIVGNTDDGGILVDDAISGDDGGLHGADYSVPYEVSEDQYNAMLGHVTAIENNTSDVYTVTDNNCTNFVRDVLEVGSVNHPVGLGPVPDSLIPGEGLISNDNYRFDEEKGWIRNSSPEHLGVLDGAGASAEEISALNQYNEWLLSQGNPEAVPDEWFIDRNEQLSNTPGLGSDVDNEGSGEGEYDPDSIVGFDDDGNPVTAAEAGLNSGDSGAAVGNSLVGDGGIDINVGAEQNAALQSGAQNATDLYHAIEGGDEISMLLEGGSLLLDIDRYMDTNGGGFIGDASESGIGNALDVGQSAYGFYNALENGSTVSQIGSGMIVLNKDMEQSLSLFISWNAPRNEPKKRTLSRRATRSLRFSAKTGAAQLTRTSLRQCSRLSVLACDAWRREPEISNSNLLR